MSFNHLNFKSMNFKSSGGCAGCNAIKSKKQTINNEVNYDRDIQLTRMQQYRKIYIEQQNNNSSNLYKMPRVIRRNIKRMF